MEPLKDTLNFKDDGFLNTEIHQSQDSVKLRTNVRSREEFERWKQIYCSRTNTCFNSRYVLPVNGGLKVFRQILICHHGVKHKGKKKTSTGCQVVMDVTIRAVRKMSARKDKLLKDFPCFVTIKGQHNHTTQSADSLGQLRVLPSTRDMFVKYFEQGMTTAQAARHHLMKMNLVDDICGQANNAINPTSRAIAYMREQWMKKEHGGLNRSMFEAIEHYASNNQEVTIKIDRNGDQFCVVLVTPFMKRAHRELKEAGEVVFIDTGGCVNQVNTAIIPLLCAGPAGAVPLAVLFTSSQDEPTLTNGFSMIKNCLGEGAFYRRGTPQAFITNNCEAARKALAATWPHAQHFLCIFHHLQQVWHWLLDSTHGIEKNHRQELMAIVKALVYARSTTAFSQQWNSFQTNPLAMKYQDFTRYLAILIQRKGEWGIAYRAGVMLRGHYTNNFCEATMCIIKEIVLSRCKSHNTAQLIVFVVEIFDEYMRQRLVDVALRQRRVKPVNNGKLPMEVISPIGGGKFKVQNQSDSLEVYEVDLSIGVCTCTNGENGAICKHQAACAEYSMTVVPHHFILNNENRQWLAALAVGKDKAHEETFFKSLCDPYQELNLVNTDPNKTTENCQMVDQGCMDYVVADFNEMIPDIQESVHLVPETSASVKATVINNAQSLSRTLIEAAKKLGNEQSGIALRRLNERLKAIQTTNEFNSLLYM